MALVVAVIWRLAFKAKGSGSRSAISMSNTRKITAKRKNRIENGRRALFLGSNPHSNGDVFSRSGIERVEISIIINIRMRGMTKAVIALIEEEIIA